MRIIVNTQVMTALLGSNWSSYTPRTCLWTMYASHHLRRFCELEVDKGKLTVVACL